MLSNDGTFTGPSVPSVFWWQSSLCLQKWWCRSRQLQLLLSCRNHSLKCPYLISSSLFCHRRSKCIWCASWFQFSSLFSQERYHNRSCICPYPNCLDAFCQVWAQRTGEHFHFNISCYVYPAESFSHASSAEIVEEINKNKNKSKTYWNLCSILREVKTMWDPFWKEERRG